MFPCLNSSWVLFSQEFLQRKRIQASSTLLISEQAAVDAARDAVLAVQEIDRGTEVALARLRAKRWLSFKKYVYPYDA